MARAILLIGDTGAGKSTSLINLPPDETIIISPNTKDLPWEGSGAQYNAEKQNFILCTKMKKRNVLDTKEEPGVVEWLYAINEHKKNIKYVVIEDLTHYMNDRMMDDVFIRTEDWGKWNKFGADVFAITTKHIAQFRDDLTVIVIGHTEVKESGTIGLQTAGRLLDNTLKLPGYFTYIFHARIFNNNGKLEYKFQTHNDGKYLAKTPLGLYKEDFIDNDISKIISRINEYRNKTK